VSRTRVERATDGRLSLENIIEHAFILCNSGLIESTHLPPELCEIGAHQVASYLGGLTVKALEAIHIADAIHRHNGNRTAAARELGIHPSTLFRKVKAMGIELPDGLLTCLLSPSLRSLG
jgi:transcriptional regulator of acetoin/glycerol metabolism